jgi:hypothetical protein
MSRPVLSDARSSAALQLVGYASAAQRVAGVGRLVPHALVRLLRPCSATSFLGRLWGLDIADD